MAKDQGIRAKKGLGQHFLKDQEVARNIADSILTYPGRKVLEVGPGTGILTQFLHKKEIDLSVIEIDKESVVFLKEKFPGLKIIQGDFLQEDLSAILNNDGAVIGNFPYHISSQILFHCLEYRDYVSEISGMFQKEVAERIAARHGNKTYGVISVLLQTFYEAEYLMTIEPDVFIPPPKVKSAVVRLKRKESPILPHDEPWFNKVVKTAFNQRRKTLRNALKPLLKGIVPEHPFMSKRAEQLSVSDFIDLSEWLGKL